CCMSCDHPSNNIAGMGVEHVMDTPQCIERRYHARCGALWFSWAFSSLVRRFEAWQSRVPQRPVADITQHASSLHAHTSVTWRHTPMLKTLTPCTLLFLVGFHCHAAAWSYAADQLPFKILHDDDNFYAQVQTLTPPDDVLREHRDLFDEHDLETSMFDDEGIASDTQPPLQKRYGRATLESLALLGLVASFYWGTQVAADSYHYDVSLATL